MTIILLRTEDSSPTEVVSFLIFLIFKIKDFERHYFKLEALQGYT